MKDPAMYHNHASSSIWLKATLEDELAADPVPALVYVARDAMAGAAVLTPVTSEHPLLARICDACED